MPDEAEKRPTELVEESRSALTDAAIVLTPVAILGQPIVGAWANQQFSGKAENDQPDPPPPPQEPPKAS
jgi:hypothetical protein